MIDKRMKKARMKLKSSKEAHVHARIIKRNPNLDSFNNQCTSSRETENFLFDLQGQAVKIGDTLYIRYKEIQPDGTDVPVTMKIMPDGLIQLIRSGKCACV